ncbi:MAG: hypothetical protein Q7S81_02240 [bacterium]|nr:hypothetical protein [bacterium]
MHFQKYGRNNFFHTLRRLQNERGEASEEKVSRACAALKQKGFIYDFSQSEKNSFNDRVRKRDFLIIVMPYRKIWFQVKSSNCGVQNHLGKNTDVPVIKIESQYSTEDVERILIEKFSLSIPE